MGGFAGYMLIGVYLKKFPIFIENKISAFLFVIGLLVLGTIPIIWGYTFNRSALPILTKNLSLTSALYVTAIYVFFKNFKLPTGLERWMTIIAKYSFGIYLIHILIVREVVWKILENSRLPHPIIETPFIAITSLLICLGIVKALSFLPKSEYSIGS